MATNFREALALSMPTIPPPPLADHDRPSADTWPGSFTLSGQRWITPAARGLIRALESRDACTGRHCRRVVHTSLRLARQLGCDDQTHQSVSLGGLLHDIGKIGMNDVVLKKQGVLSESERQRMSKHPELGYAIIEGVESLEPALPVVLYHHESWDGSGYPFGLRGEQIPLAARICAVADAFDAMSTVRPYRMAMHDDQVEAILRDGAGRQWDPQVIGAYCACRAELNMAVQRFERGGPRHGLNPPVRPTIRQIR